MRFVLNVTQDHMKGECKMSADWFYVKKRFFWGPKTVGPIAESEFLRKIEKGEINPETMVSSTSKTHGHWMHLKQIRAGVKHWEKTHPTTHDVA